MKTTQNQNRALLRKPIETKMTKLPSFLCTSKLKKEWFSKKDQDSVRAVVDAEQKARPFGGLGFLETSWEFQKGRGPRDSQGTPRPLQSFCFECL